MPRIEALVVRSIFLSAPSEDVQRARTDYPHLHFEYMPATRTARALELHNLSRVEEGLGLAVVDALEEFAAFMVDM